MLLIIHKALCQHLSILDMLEMKMMVIVMVMILFLVSGMPSSFSLTVPHPLIIHSIICKEDKLDAFPIRLRVKQGSPLSPLLFNIIRCHGRIQPFLIPSFVTIPTVKYYLGQSVIQSR